MKAVKLRKLH